MNFFSRLTSFFKKAEDTKEKVEIKDLRTRKSDLNKISVQDNEADPAMKAMLNAAFNSDKPVIGQLEGNTLTIKDHKD
jgi:hypothetical protein